MDSRQRQSADDIVHLVVWVFGNLIGDNNYEYNQRIFEQTDFLNFLGGLVNRTDPLPSNFLTIIPWVINSILNVN